MTKRIKIYGPSGIGDQLWFLQKLYSYKSENLIDFELYSWERDNVSSPFLLGLERIEKVSQFRAPFTTYTQFKNKCNEMYPTYKNMSMEEVLNQNELYLEANTFLEQANRLEDYLPQFPTTYELPWKHNQQHYDEIMNICRDSNVIVLYTSNVKNNSFGRNIMNGWDYNKWLELTTLLFKTYPGVKIVWIGGAYDKTSYQQFQEKFKGELLYLLLDQPSTKIYPLFKNCKCFISYQSGLSCISMSEKTPTYMLYFDNLKGLPYSICPPESIKNKSVYNPEFFCNINLNNIVKWVEQHLTY